MIIIINHSSLLVLLLFSLLF